MPLHRAPLVMLLLASLAMCAAACATVAGTAPATPPAGSADDPATLYARIASYVREQGGTHAVIETHTVGAQKPYVTVRNVWLDGEGRGREEALTTFWLGDTPVVRRASTLIDGDVATLAREQSPLLTHEALVCRGAPDAATSLLIGCRGFLETSDTAARHTGDGPALVTTGVLAGAGSRTWFQDSLQLQASVSLPASLDAVAVVDEGGVMHDLRTRTTYRFEPYDMALAPGLYDPSTLGRAAATPVAALDDMAPGVPWPRLLTLPGEGELALASSFVVPPQAARWLPYRAELSYRPAADAFAPPVITLRLLQPGQIALYGSVAIATPAGVVIVLPASPSVSQSALDAAAVALAALLP